MGRDLLVFFEWGFKEMTAGSVELEFIFWFDWMSCVFFSLVILISCYILVYRVWYMGGDEGIRRFVYMILMFVLSMVMVILRPNLVRIMLGWDGLGLVSYCLIIYYNNWSSYVSGMITIIFNRLGDIGVLLCIGLMVNYGDWGMIMFSGDCIGGYAVNSLLGVFLILAGITRSAQIPFCR